MKRPQYFEMPAGTCIRTHASAGGWLVRGTGALLDVALRSGPPSRCFMLHVDPSREAAVSLYTSKGFVQTGPLLHEYYMKGRHAMLMTKTPPQPL
jgi:hypothetical protein